MKAWTRTIGVALGAVLLTTTGTGVATAAPSRLARSEFAAAVAGRPTIVETFDGFMEGMYSPAIPLANGVYVGTGPWVYRVGALNSVLSDGTDVASPRTFSAFPNGTRYWGADIGMDGRSMLSVTVVGAAETMTFEVRADELNGFLGISDPVGLRAVTIVNVGQFNLAFDNVTTASGAAAPGASAEVASPPMMASTQSVVVLDASDSDDDAVMAAARTDAGDPEVTAVEDADTDSSDVAAQPADGDDGADPEVKAAARAPVRLGSTGAGETSVASHVAAARAPRLTTTH